MMQTLMAVEPFGSLIVAVSRFTPFFLVVAAFTFVYIFIPNTRVKFRYAFLAGLIAGVSWQAAGMIFASFVAGSAKYAAIYSGWWWDYPADPDFNWMILPLGASLSYYMQNLARWPSAVKYSWHRSCKSGWHWP